MTNFIASAPNSPKSGTSDKPNHDPSLMHSLPWIIGWVSLSLTGPILMCKLLSRVGMAFFRRYLMREDCLAGKVVLVTGASSGVGEALSKALYRRGCQLVLAARSLDKLVHLKDHLMATCQPCVVHEPVVLRLDISDLASVPLVLGPMLARLPPVDILVNNAGQSYRGLAAETLMDVDLKLMLVNYFGHVAVTKEVLRGMIQRQRGHILSVSSIQGRLAIPYRSSYTASKHALQGYMDSLRAEVATHNIAVSVLSPGYIATNLSLNALTGCGDNYGVMDSSTSGGMSAASVADHLVTMLETGQEESLLCPWHHRAALALRYWAPWLLSMLMKRRAGAQLHQVTPPHGTAEGATVDGGTQAVDGGREALTNRVQRQVADGGSSMKGMDTCSGREQSVGATDTYSNGGEKKRL